MKKTINNIIPTVFLLYAMLFNIASATKGGAMGMQPFYDSTICFNKGSSNPSYLARPAINKDNGGQIKTTIQQDMQLANSEADSVPKQNQEDRVIEFIVSDIGR